MRRALARLLRDDGAVSAVEFALILPMLVMFSAGTIEYSRLLLLTQKLQSGAFILADLTARNNNDLHTQDLSNIFLALDQVVRPFAFAGNGRAYVSSIGADEDDEPFLWWQCAGAGSLDVESALVDGDEIAPLPGDIPLKHGDTLIAAEVFFHFDPLFGIGLAPRTIHRVAFYKPRLGELTELECPEE